MSRSLIDHEDIFIHLYIYLSDLLSELDFKKIPYQKGNDVKNIQIMYNIAVKISSESRLIKFIVSECMEIKDKIHVSKL